MPYRGRGGSPWLPESNRDGPTGPDLMVQKPSDLHPDTASISDSAAVRSLCRAISRLGLVAEPFFGNGISAVDDDDLAGDVGRTR